MHQHHRILQLIAESKRPAGLIKSRARPQPATDHLVEQPAIGQQVQRRLRHWQGDQDLAGLRDPAAVAQLPAEEQQACRQLWADVEALLAKAAGGAPAGRPPNRGK